MCPKSTKQSTPTTAVLLHVFARSSMHTYSREYTRRFQKNINPERKAGWVRTCAVVCMRERERERERACAQAHAHAHAHAHGHIYLATLGSPDKRQTFQIQHNNNTKQEATTPACTYLVLSSLPPATDQIGHSPAPFDASTTTQRAHTTKHGSGDTCCGCCGLLANGAIGKQSALRRSAKYILVAAMVGRCTPGTPTVENKHSRQNQEAVVCHVLPSLVSRISLPRPTQLVRNLRLCFRGGRSTITFVFACHILPQERTNGLRNSETNYR